MTVVSGKSGELVIPAKAGIQTGMPCAFLDSGFRRNDEMVEGAPRTVMPAQAGIQ